LLAGDEAWLYLQATTMAVWSLRGVTPVVPAHPGRQKIGFHGALNLKTGIDLVTRTLEFTSEIAAAHLELILATYPAVNMRQWWDRAPWHGGAAVKAVLAANPRLRIVKFPVAAPDLNPQEQTEGPTLRLTQSDRYA